MLGLMALYSEVHPTVSYIVHYGLDILAPVYKLQVCILYCTEPLSSEPIMEILPTALVCMLVDVYFLLISRLQMRFLLSEGSLMTGYIVVCGMTPLVSSNTVKCIPLSVFVTKIPPKLTTTITSILNRYLCG